MNSRMRSLSGAALMLMIIPIFAGLLACMPEVAPVGNPERARVDPDLSGVWILNDEDEVGGIYYFEPYDKRTWLITGVEFEAGDEFEGADEVVDYDALMNIMLDENRGVGAKGVTGGGISLYKAWTTRLSGDTFLTWTILGALNEDGTFGIDFAYNWRMKSIDSGHLTLQFIDMEGPAFEGVDLMNRRALEKVIRRHADEEGFFEEEVYTMVKAKPEHLPAFAKLLRQMVGEV